MIVTAPTPFPSPALHSIPNPKLDPSPDPSPEPQYESSCTAASGTPVKLHPGADLPGLVADHPQGTTFCLASGMYRIRQRIYLKPGDTFIGEPGATLNGARIIDHFERSGPFWKATGQAQEGVGDPESQCKATHPGCNRPDDVYFDDRPLHRIPSLAGLGPGEFFFDYPSDTIFIADNPNGHTVEAAVAPGAITGVGYGGGVVRGLTIEKFAGNGIQSKDWIVEENEVLLNHGVGISVDHDGVVRNNYVHDNGHIGIASGGEARFNDLVEGNEIAFNNYAGYAPGWEAGGVKLVLTKHLTIRDNYVHDNYGAGIWIDTMNTDVLIEKNRVNDNDAEGVIVEASSDVVVRNNWISRNGHISNPVWVLGAGIQNENSADVSVYGNVLVDNFNGITATQRLRSGASPDVKNFLVHDNVITATVDRGITGISQVVGDPSYYTHKGNHFWRNTYYLGCQPRPFVWSNLTGDYAYLTTEQWRQTGNAVGSRFFTSAC